MLSLKERLTEILIDHKIVSEDQLKKALSVQEEKGGRLSDIMVELKFIQEGELVSLISRSLGLPLIDLKRFKIDPELLKIIPADIARHYLIMPVSKISDTVTLAMADPLNIFAIDHVKSLTGYNINPVISASKDIIQAIEASYPDATKSIIDDLVKEISASSIELIKEESEVLPSDQELDRISREAPVIKITNMILEEAVLKKSSDILLEPFDKRLRIRFRLVASGQPGLAGQQPALKEHSPKGHDQASCNNAPFHGQMQSGNPFRSPAQEETARK